MGDRLTQELMVDIAKEISESLPPVVNRQALYDRIEAMCEVNTEGPISREGSPYWQNGNYYQTMPEGFGGQAGGREQNQRDWLAYQARQLEAERAKEAALIDRIAEAVVAKLKAAT